MSVVALLVLLCAVVVSQVPPTESLPSCPVNSTSSSGSGGLQLRNCTCSHQCDFGVDSSITTINFVGVVFLEAVTLAFTAANSGINATLLAMWNCTFLSALNVQNFSSVAIRAENSTFLGTVTISPREAAPNELTVTLTNTTFKGAVGIAVSGHAALRLFRVVAARVFHLPPPSNDDGSFLFASGGLSLVDVAVSFEDCGFHHKVEGAKGLRRSHVVTLTPTELGSVAVHCLRCSFTSSINPLGGGAYSSSLVYLFAPSPLGTITVSFVHSRATVRLLSSEANTNMIAVLVHIEKVAVETPLVLANRIDVLIDSAVIFLDATYRALVVGVERGTCKPDAYGLQISILRSSISLSVFGGAIAIEESDLSQSPNVLVSGRMVLREAAVVSVGQLKLLPRANVVLHECNVLATVVVDYNSSSTNTGSGAGMPNLFDNMLMLLSVGCVFVANASIVDVVVTSSVFVGNAVQFRAQPFTFFGLVTTSALISLSNTLDADSVAVVLRNTTAQFRCNVTAQPPDPIWLSVAVTLSPPGSLDGTGTVAAVFAPVLCEIPCCTSSAEKLNITMSNVHVQHGVSDSSVAAASATGGGQVLGVVYASPTVSGLRTLGLSNELMINILTILFTERSTKVPWSDLVISLENITVDVSASMAAWFGVAPVSPRELVSLAVSTRSHTVSKLRVDLRDLNVVAPPSGNGVQLCAADNRIFGVLSFVNSSISSANVSTALITIDSAPLSLSVFALNSSSLTDSFVALDQVRLTNLAGNCVTSWSAVRIAGPLAARGPPTRAVQWRLTRLFLTHSGRGEVTVFPDNGIVWDAASTVSTACVQLNGKPLRLSQLNAPRGVLRDVIDNNDDVVLLKDCQPVASQTHSTVVSHTMDAQSNDEGDARVLSAAVAATSRAAFASTTAVGFLSAAGGGAGDVQALASVLGSSCASGQVRGSSGTMMYLIAPFVYFGPGPAALGNIFISAMVLVGHGGYIAVSLYRRRSGRTRTRGFIEVLCDSSPSTAQFPNVFVRVSQFLLAGVVLFSLRVLVEPGGSPAGWMVVAAVGLLWAVGWVLFMHLVLYRRCCAVVLHFRAHAYSVRWPSAAKRFLLPLGRWGPQRFQTRCGALISDARGAPHAGRWWVPTVVLLCVQILGALPFTENAPCVVVLAIVAALSLASSVYLFVQQPHRSHASSCLRGLHQFLLFVVALLLLLTRLGHVYDDAVVAVSACSAMLSVVKAAHILLIAYADSATNPLGEHPPRDAAASPHASAKQRRRQSFAPRNVVQPSLEYPKPLVAQQEPPPTTWLRREPQWGGISKKHLREWNGMMHGRPPFPLPSSANAVKNFATVADAVVHLQSIACTPVTDQELLYRLSLMVEVISAALQL